MKLCNILTGSLIVAGMLTPKVQAQQIFTISQFVQHNFIINPAAAGASDQASIGATYRNMWNSMPGGPETALLFGDMYFDKKNVGLAAVIYDDKTGPTSRTGGEVNLSYSIKLEGTRRLQFGLGAQVLQFKINKAAIADYIPNDPLLASSGNSLKGDASAGIYYRSEGLNVGFSVKQLIQSKFNFIKTSANPEGKLYRHFYLMGSYNLHADADNVLVPNFMLQYAANAPADYSAGIRLEHKRMVWIGFNHHFKQGFSAMAGVYAGPFSIGYAYDRYSTPLNLFDDGSGAHEISVRYYFKK